MISRPFRLCARPAPGDRRAFAAFLAMGKKKRAASGAPVGDFSDGGSMMREQRDRWRQAHPPRNYFGHPLQRASKGRQFAGGVRARRHRQGVATEFLLFVPYHARIGVGQNTHPPPLGKSDDELLVYDHSAPGESRSELLLVFQQQTSVRRWYELAGTHPGKKKAFRAGISTADVAPSPVECWRRPGGRCLDPLRNPAGAVGVAGLVRRG